MQSLGCVLAATVRGARGSHVPLIIGLSRTRQSRRRRATEPHFHAPEWAARPMTTDIWFAGTWAEKRQYPPDGDPVLARADRKMTALTGQAAANPGR
jgi:hypothetical protein